MNRPNDCPPGDRFLHVDPELLPIGGAVLLRCVAQKKKDGIAIHEKDFCGFVNELGRFKVTQAVYCRVYQR